MKTIIILSHVTFDDSPYCSYVHSHAKELVKQGYNVIVFAIIHWFPILSCFQKYKKIFMKNIKINNKIQKIDGVQVIYERATSFSNLLYNSCINLNGISYYYKIKKIFKKIYNENEIILIDAHTFKTEGYVACKLKKKYGIKTFITIHGTSFRRNFNTKEGRKRIKDICNNVDCVIAVSEKLNNQLKSLGISNSEVVYNGVSDYKTDINFEKNKYKIITVGKLIKQKRIDFIIEAIKKLSNKYSNLSLTIIGEGPEKNNLENLCKELEINQKVEFLGQIDNSEVLSQMQKSNIFILPSINEGFGIVYIEAMKSRVYNDRNKK